MNYRIVSEEIAHNTSSSIEPAGPFALSETWPSLPKCPPHQRNLLSQTGKRKKRAAHLRHSPKKEPYKHVVLSSLMFAPAAQNPPHPNPHPETLTLVPTCPIPGSVPSHLPSPANSPPNGRLTTFLPTMKVRSTIGIASQDMDGTRLTNTSAPQFVASLLALALAALAAPTPTPDTAVSWNQNFSCGADFRTKFCHAINFKSHCVNGRFYSDAGDSCANCWCTCTLLPVLSKGGSLRRRKRREKERERERVTSLNSLTLEM